MPQYYVTLNGLPEKYKVFAEALMKTVHDNSLQISFDGKPTLLTGSLLSQKAVLAEPAEIEDKFSNTAVSEKTVAAAFMEYTAGLTRLVVLAFERMKKNEYEICEICEEEISSKRLMAVPHTPYCIRCQEKNELKGPTHQLKHFSTRPIIATRYQCH